MSPGYLPSNSMDVLLKSLLSSISYWKIQRNRDRRQRVWQTQQEPVRFAPICSEEFIWRLTQRCSIKSPTLLFLCSKRLCVPFTEQLFVSLPQRSVLVFIFLQGQCTAFTGALGLWRLETTTSQDDRRPSALQGQERDAIDKRGTRRRRAVQLLGRGLRYRHL